MSLRACGVRVAAVNVVIGGLALVACAEWALAVDIEAGGGSGSGGGGGGGSSEGAAWGGTCRRGVLRHRWRSRQMRRWVGEESEQAWFELPELRSRGDVVHPRLC